MLPGVGKHPRCGCGAGVTALALMGVTMAGIGLALGLFIGYFWGRLSEREKW